MTSQYEVPSEYFPEKTGSKRISRIAKAAMCLSISAASLAVGPVSEGISQECRVGALPEVVCDVNSGVQDHVAELASRMATLLPNIPIVISAPVVPR